MSHGEFLVELVRKAKKDFGDSYPKKFGGAAAAAILKTELHQAGIPTSARDVFIKGSSCEVDLLIPTANVNPWLDLLYTPSEVAVALEVKKSGCFSKDGADKIKRDFDRLRTLGILCAYVTFEDRQSYRWRPTEEHLGHPCFAFAWHIANDGPLTLPDQHEGWEAFVQFIQDARDARAQKLAEG
jgi:hypothetical protein